MGKLRGLKARHKQDTKSQSPAHPLTASKVSVRSDASSTLVSRSIFDSGSCSRVDSAVCLVSDHSSFGTEDALGSGGGGDAVLAAASPSARKISKPHGHPHRNAIIGRTLLVANEPQVLSDVSEAATSEESSLSDDDGLSAASTVHGERLAGVGVVADPSTSTELLVLLEGFPCDMRSAPVSRSTPASISHDGGAPSSPCGLLRSALTHLRGRGKKAQYTTCSTFNPAVMTRLRPAGALQYLFATFPIYCSNSGQRVRDPGCAWVGETTEQVVERVMRDLREGVLVIRGAVGNEGVFAVLGGLMKRSE